MVILYRLHKPTGLELFRFTNTHTVIGTKQDGANVLKTNVTQIID